MKRKKVTFADLSAGNLTDEDRARLEPPLRKLGEQIGSIVNEVVTPLQAAASTVELQCVAARLQAFVQFGKAAESEARALFDLMDKDFDEAEAYIREHPPSAYAIWLLIQIAQSAYKTDRARKNALLRAARYEPARRLAVAEWQKNRKAYNGKIDFGRIFSRRIKNEFGIDVTDTTIARDWLPKG